MWYHRFLEGANRRMGQYRRPNEALDLPLFSKSLSTVENNIEGATTPDEVIRWTVAHTYVVTSYILSLRGPEGFLLDLANIRENWNIEKLNRGFRN